ncbi:MAG: hypothetical protein ABW073_00555 [Acidimicrobiia bacterium]
MHISEGRAVWVGCGVAIVATLGLTALAAALESTVNGPGSRTLAPPVLWGFGGGLGLCIGAFLTAWLTRRAILGILAAVLAAIPFLALVILAYNDKSLTFEDQFVGSLVIVVLPGIAAAVVFAFAGVFGARLFGATPQSGSTAGSTTARKSATT